MTVAQAAAAVGVGRRTLERVFLAETGLPAGRWRQYRLLLRGLEEVADGATVQAASVIAGYRTPSAYVAAFRAAFGTTPARFLGPGNRRTSGESATRYLCAAAQSHRRRPPTP